MNIHEHLKIKSVERISVTTPISGDGYIVKEKVVLEFLTPYAEQNFRGRYALMRVIDVADSSQELIEKYLASTLHATAGRLVFKLHLTELPDEPLEYIITGEYL